MTGTDGTERTSRGAGRGREAASGRSGRSARSGRSEVSGRAGASGSSGASGRTDRAERLASSPGLFNPLWCYHGLRMCVFGLSVFGVIMVFSSSAVSAASSGKSPFGESMSQVAFCIIGLVLCLVCTRIPMPLYRKGGVFIMAAAIVLQSLTFTPLGVDAYGNAGWIGLFGMTFQPAETTKFALCVWLPNAVAAGTRHYGHTGRTLRDLWESYRVVFAIYGLALALVLGGKDLGTALIIMAIGLTAFVFGGFPGKYLAWVSIAGVLGVVAMVGLSENRRTRILAAYSDCTSPDLQDVCYQSIHARYAIASGGLLGVGLGNSREKWNYLPAAHNDFIFAVIAEETGFFGAMMVILIFVILGWCLLYSALRLHGRERYASNVLMCVAVWLVGQAFVNIGVVVGVLPVLGVPMPFVSSGGSSMIMCLAVSGVAMRMLRLLPEVKADTTRV